MYKKHQEKQSKNWDKNSTSWDHPRSGEIFDIHAFSKQAAPWSFQRLCWTPDVRDLFKRPYRQALVKFSENGKCLFLLTTFLAIFRMDKLRISGTWEVSWFVSSWRPFLKSHEVTIWFTNFVQLKRHDHVDVAEAEFYAPWLAFLGASPGPARLLRWTGVNDQFTDPRHVQLWPFISYKY